ncbi:alpha/beta hydrolase [Shewanella sp. AS16]|uniref:alpha/beta hydrolase n=1 Tax=Shewanella sp. AS16 TaxID=2907625 RepID=UPI001F3563D2|nr:alpha/beta hydrolase [Shewanella sp. AS16]MCE9687573.1 alpha/beta hydrolase [Shewanella sp. AS16]
MTMITKLTALLICVPVIYLLICLLLIYWPIQKKTDVENFNYASLSKSAERVGVGQEQWIALRDGSQLFSRVYESKASATLVLLHGSGAESRYLSRIASSLASAGLFRVVTPDLRGHGRNAGRRGDIDYIGQLEHDIEDVLTHLQTKYAGSKIVLGGHSSGGGLALRYVGSGLGKQPSALLLFSPYLGHDAPSVKPDSGGWVTVALKRIIGLSMLNKVGISGFNHLDVLSFNRPEAWNDALQLPGYSYRMMVNFSPNDYLEDIASIEVPTLVLVGEKDESFYPEQFKPLFDASEADTEVHIVSDANHMNIIDNSQSFEYLSAWHKAAIQPPADASSTHMK